MIAALAIALTTILFTSLFTIAMSLNSSYQTYTFRQIGGYAHGTFKEVSEDQIQALKSHKLVKEAGERTVVGSISEDSFAKVPAEISYMDMDFGEALGNGGMGFAAWLTAVFSFAHARKCQEEAQRESDPQRQSFLKRQASSLVNLSYILVLLMPILIPMIFSAIDAFY